MTRVPVFIFFPCVESQGKSQLLFTRGKEEEELCQANPALEKYNWRDKGSIKVGSRKMLPWHYPCPTLHYMQHKGANPSYRRFVEDWSQKN